MTKTFKKEYSGLCKFYKNKLKAIDKSNCDYLAAGIDYFILYLQFMRDFFILTSSDINPETNIKLSSLCAAIVAYENYNNSFNLFYDVVNNVPVPKDSTKSKEAVMKEYNEYRATQWSLFCGSVALNLEEWTANVAGI